MTSHPLELYSAYLDGRCLSEPEVFALRRWITADERHARQFVEFALLHASITDRLTLGQLLDDLASRRPSGVVSPDMLADAIRDIEVNSPRVELAPPLPAPAPEEREHWFPTLAAVLVCVCLGAVAFWRATPLPAPAPTVAESDSASSTVAEPPAPEPRHVAARVAASFDAVWEGDEAPAVASDVWEGSSFTLRSGVVQFEMAGGAKAVLEGPSEFQLTHENSLKLASGKAAVRIGEGGGQFIVTTPTMEVVDLGTEFGVQASPGGEGRVMVFDGAVSLEPAKDAGAESRPLSLHNRLDAGFEVKLDKTDSAGPVFSKVAPLKNDRYFLRPDEVEVRQRALAGSLEAHQLAAHYERRRIEGLLAYQGFDVRSAGNDHILGFLPQALYFAESTSVGFEEGRGQLTGYMRVQNGPVFLQLNTLADGPFAAAGLLNEAGLVGKAGTELWLRWRARRVTADPSSTGSVGVSVMFGERSDVDEPLFFGRGHGTSQSFVTQTAWGGAPAPDGQRITAELDADATVRDVQPMLVDEREHVWVARLQFHDGVDRASVWIDPDLSQIDFLAPQATLDVAGVEFDRIRMAVNRGEEVWQFGDFAAALTPGDLAQLEQVGSYQSDLKPRPSRPL